MEEEKTSSKTKIHLNYFFFFTNKLKSIKKHVYKKNCLEEKSMEGKKVIIMTNFIIIMTL